MCAGKARGLLLLCALALLLTLVACRTTAPESETLYTIGVAVYDPDSAEMQMFLDYYRDYIAEGFPVKFYFSGRITSAAEEQDFIRQVKQAGAGGVISFCGTGPVPVLETCAENVLYARLRHAAGRGF